MIVTLIIISLALVWLLIETKGLSIRLPQYVQIEDKTLAEMVHANLNLEDKPIIKTLLLPEFCERTSKSILALPAGNPANYPMTLTTDIKTLKAMIDQLSKTELELTEEVIGYDYSDQT